MSAPVALFLPSLEHGGAERVMIELAAGLAARGRSVDLVVASARGDYASEVPRSVSLIDLGVSRTLAALVPLARYLRRRRPRALLSTMNHANVVALGAAELSRTRTRVVVREASNVSGQRRDALTLRGRLTPAVMRLAYRRASRVVAVSEATADDLCGAIGYPRERVEIVYNPVDFAGLRARAAEASGHAWLDDPSGPPVVLGVGRLSPEKEWDVLIRGFAQLGRERPSRLVIIGEGAERRRLEAQVAELGVERDVSLPGFAANPFAFIARASALVLASRWEGLPNVLIHALALGTPVVATDCPGGTREILSGGRYGSLVPIGDASAMAAAIARALDGEAPAVDASWRARFDRDAVVARFDELLSGDA